MTGASAADCAAAWNSGAVYNGGNIASHSGRNWRAQWWTQGETPGTTGEWGVWRDQGTCSGGGGGTNPPPPPPPPPGSGTVQNWQAGTDYPAGSVVRYTNGQCYRAKHANPGYDPIISTWFWEPTTCSGGGTTNPPPPSNPGAFPVTEAQFNQMFPSRIPFYTYGGLVNAAQKYVAFTEGAAGKLEVVAFLANIAHESGGLKYTVELNTANYPNYCDASRPYGCPAGRAMYYGRGPMQLSWNFNYKAAGDALGRDLLNNPNLVATDATIAFETAVWYWMTQNGPGTRPAHVAIRANDFNGTVRAINGSIECNGGNPAQVQSRINNLENFARIAGVNLSGVARDARCGG
ncbi:glycoside hydrolase family 19 protein [Spirilliplanes yamanashiensis]|nr:glycoside hydrolase family 19 protein [Spirilliplanes yamanashiensis]MDP9814650.1 chitodextrinase [Spirilliplanes yamanashiensis]